MSDVLILVCPHIWFLGPQYLSDCLRNMEQIKLGRRSDAEVLNLVPRDLPAISDYFINLDLGIVRVCHCIYPLSDS